MSEVKVRVKLVDDNAVEDKVFVTAFPDGTTLDKLIEESIASAGWSDRNLVVKSARIYEEDFNEYADIPKPHDSLTLANKQRFEIHLNKETPEAGTILADITINETIQQGQKLALPSGSTVIDFIMAVISTFCKDATDTTVDFVKYFDSDFDEFADVAKPYESAALNFQSRYAISITYGKIPTKPNNTQQDKEPKANKNATNANKSSETGQRPVVPDIIRSYCRVQLGEAIERKALGRVAELGQFYDARTEQFISGKIFNRALPYDAVKMTNTPPMVPPSFECVTNETLHERLEKLHVEPELKASIVCKMVDVSGHGEYLISDTVKTDEASSTLIYVKPMKNEMIKFDNPAVASMVSPNSVQDIPEATHVLVGIQWGIVAAVTLKCDRTNPNDISIEDDLKAKLSRIRTSITGQGFVRFEPSSRSRDYRFEMFIDNSLKRGDGPKNLDDVASCLKRLPSIAATVNEGRGIPISYTLLPLSTFQHHLAPIDDLNSLIVNKIDEEQIEIFAQMLEGIGQSVYILSKILAQFQEFYFCIPKEPVENVDGYYHTALDYEANLRTQLYQVIVDIRSGKSDCHQRLDEIINEYHQHPASPANFNAVIEPFAPWHEKIEFVSCLLQHKVTYVNRDGKSDRIREKDKFDECYIFFCEWSNATDLQGNSWYFNALTKDHKYPCLFVDIDAHPEIAKNEGVPAGNRICLYNNKTYESTNYYGDYLEDQKKCYVKCKKDRAGSSKLDMSSRRVEVDMICPQSMQGDFCSRDIREWYCADCRERLQYDFKQNFHCECGHAPVNTFLFRCSDPNHKVDFIGFGDNYISSLVSKIQPYKETNILILGETGVGKSTWINGLSNYLTYSTLEDAEHGKQIYLVPSQFTITDSNRRLKKITVGKSKNEIHEEGVSSTQHPKSYVFNVGKKSVRLIDTPGIGDTRGADVDDKNFVEILKYIAQFDEIHGICILLKPNNARLNLTFRYCISQLLAHLDVTAAANIVFCFTNARGTFYRPGDTMPTLNAYLDNLKSEKKVEIPTDEDRVYCMDNESFRFLCCLHAKEYFSDEEKKNFEQSWNLSVEETNRLLKHFENHVTPHVVARTVSLNSARELILTLAKPLADISQIIQDNIAAMNEKAEEVQALNVRKDDLMKKLMIPQIGLQPKELGYPQTVCTGIHCVETEILPNTGTQKIIYKTICHDHCVIPNVTPEIVPNTALQNCKAMDKTTLKCINCGCPWDLHMHITYTQEKTEILVEDPEIQRKLRNTNSDKEKQEIIVQTYKDLINKYKAEQTAIDEACAKFAAFLNKHAIIPYSDAVEDYLRFNIREAEQAAGNRESKKGQKKVERLEQQLRDYKEKKRILSNQLANGTAQLIDASDIQNIQKELEKLEMTGPNIKLLFEATVTGKEINLVQQEMYFNKASYQKRRRTRKPYAPPTDYETSDNENEIDFDSRSKKQLRNWGTKVWNVVDSFTNYFNQPQHKNERERKGNGYGDSFSSNRKL